MESFENEMNQSYGSSQFFLYLNKCKAIFIDYFFLDETRFSIKFDIFQIKLIQSFVIVLIIK